MKKTTSKTTGTMTASEMGAKSWIVRKEKMSDKQVKLHFTELGKLSAKKRKNDKNKTN